MEKKEEICKKTQKLFVERGYDNTPMSFIAEELGLSKGGLFHHYKTKEDLLHDIIENLLERNFVPLIENARKISDPKERIIYFIDSYTKLMASDNAAKIVMHEAQRLDPVHYEKVRKIWRQTFDLLRGTFSGVETLRRGQRVEQ